MAKKIQGAEITFRVTDDGTLKMVGQKAEKAAKSIDKLGGASQATDRRIKGVTQQSSNASKNFSKQAQTMQGGIVAVYATIAARVFAVSAAFQFLKEAFETRNLIEGQLAFGAATGVAYGTMTEGIIKASGGLIQFKEAAQAAAIGSAAGLTSDQLNRLGTAAKNTSLALGRDLTDSFNRLIRGTTKAEPELLDELGIILRLEPAMEKYALSIGKSKDDLNQFEKSQAVANEVLDQAETKFGAIEKTMDPAGFALQRFLKAFDDVMKGIKEKVTNILIPVIGFFANNIGSLIGTMLLFLAPILKSIMPDFGTMSDNLAQKARDHAAALEQETIALQRLDQELNDFDDNMGTKDIAEQDRSLEFEKAGMEKTTTSGHTRASKHYHDQTEKIEAGTLKKRTGKYKDFGNDQVKILDKANDKVVNHSKKSWLKVRMHMGKTGKQLKAVTSAMKIKWAGAMKFMVRGAQAMATAVNWAMKAMGWLGIILMVIDGLKMLWQWVFPPDEVKAKQQESFDGMMEHYKGLNIEVTRMNEAQLLGVNNLTGSIQQIGSAFQSVDISKVIKDYNAMLQMGKINTTEGQEMIQNVTGQLDLLSGGDEKMKPLINALKEGKHIGDKFFESDKGKGVMKFANDLMGAAAATKLLTEQQKSLNASIKSVMGSVKQNKFVDVYKNYGTVIETMKSRQSVSAVGKIGMIRARDAMGETAKTDEQALKDYEKKAGRDKHTSSYEQRQIDKLREKARVSKEAWEVQKQNVIDAGTQEEKWQKELDATGAIQTKINTLMDDEYALVEAQLKVKKEAAGISTVSMTGETKNLRLNNKLKDQTNKIEDKRIKYDAAKLVLLTATNEEMADPVWKKAAEKAENQAKENLAIETETGKRIEEKTEWQTMLNLQKDEDLKIQREIKLETLQNAFITKELAQNVKNATTAAEEFEAQLAVQLDKAKKLDNMQKNKANMDAKLLEMQGKDEKNQVAIDKLKGQIAEADQKILNTLQAQTFEIQKQLNLLNAVDAKKKLNQQQIEFQNLTGMEGNTMFGGNAVGNLGSQFGMINPNAKAQRGALTKAGVTSWEGYSDKAAQWELQKAALAQYTEKVENKEDMTGVTVETIKASLQGNSTEMKKFADLGNKAANSAKETATAGAQLQVELELANSIQGAMGTAFTGMFTAMIDGTKSFGDAMGDVMKQLLADLAAAYMQAAALKMLSAMGFGLPARYGGELSPAGKSFAAGGVASGPTSGYLATLHGREAVVPLGNDRSIPVDLKGASGNVVNVAVNINGGQSQTTTAGGGADMQALGRSIGGLVQQHLQVEMRPGGLLNRQGASGRQGGGG